MVSEVNISQLVSSCRYSVNFVNFVQYSVVLMSCILKLLFSHFSAGIKLVQFLFVPFDGVIWQVTDLQAELADTKTALKASFHRSV